jgi:hypothetical protein
MDLVQIKLDKDKELQVLNLDGSYHGVVWDGETLMVTCEGFSSALKAANETRKLKKTKNLKTTVKKQNKARTTKPKIAKEKKLKFYTEAEMTQLTHLRFREAWVILNRHGGFVERSITEKEVVKYNNTQGSAQVFKSYEDARMTANVLDRVHEPGHTLRRFYVENK